MKNRYISFSTWLIIIFFALCTAAVGYVYHVRLWANSEWAGMTAVRGDRYRRWSLRFCDGMVMNGDGSMSPVIVEEGHFRRGHYHLPRFDYFSVGMLPRFRPLTKDELPLPDLPIK